MGVAEMRSGTAQAEQERELAAWVRQARRGVRGPDRRGRVLAVSGGKGGVGKSSLSLNLGLALRERGRRVLLVDCDAGLGSLDILLGLAPSRNVGDVLRGRCALEEALLVGPLGLRLLPAATAPDDGGEAGAGWTELVERLRLDADVVLLDARAGLGRGVDAVLGVADEVLVVTTPEPTALADAYATLKTLHLEGQTRSAGVVVNMTRDHQEAQGVFGALTSVCRVYLDWEPVYLGCIPWDCAMPRAVREQWPLLLSNAQAPAARAVRLLAAEVTRWAAARAEGVPG